MKTEDEIQLGRQREKKLQLTMNEGLQTARRGPLWYLSADALDEELELPVVGNASADLETQGVIQHLHGQDSDEEESENDGSDHEDSDNSAEDCCVDNKKNRQIEAVGQSDENSCELGEYREEAQNSKMEENVTREEHHDDSGITKFVPCELKQLSDVLSGK
jgi:hypothetical protein